MMIRIMYNNRKYDMVKDSRLDRLITSGKIRKFFRSDGWATIGFSPIRGKGGNYRGSERRKSTCSETEKISLRNNVMTR